MPWTKYSLQINAGNQLDSDDLQHLDLAQSTMDFSCKQISVVIVGIKHTYFIESREIAVHLFKTEVIVYKQYLMEYFELQQVIESLNLAPIFLTVNIFLCAIYQLFIMGSDYHALIIYRAFKYLMYEGPFSNDKEN